MLRVRLPIALAVLAGSLACAGERAAAPEPATAAPQVLRTADLSRIRCVLLAPLENGSDTAAAADAAAEGLAAAIDPARATVLPIPVLRATFQGTPLELPTGIGPPLALDLADLLEADAALSGAVDGRSTGPTAELVISVRLALAGDRTVLFARTVVVRPAPGERVDELVRREVLAAARPALAEIGSATPRRCFDRDRLSKVRLAAGRKPALPATAPAPAPPPAPAAAASATRPPPPAARPLPLTARQGTWARQLASGQRVLLEDVSFIGRSAALERATGVEDLAAALAAVPDGKLVLEGFVDATSDHEGDEQLSRAMALAVADRLAALGVPRARLVSSGRGGDQANMPNFTLRGRASNRRVEALVQR